MMVLGDKLKAVTSYRFTPMVEVNIANDGVSTIFIHSGLISGIVDNHGRAYKTLANNPKTAHKIEGEQAVRMKALVADYFADNESQFPDSFQFLSIYAGAEKSSDLDVVCAGHGYVASIGCLINGRLQETEKILISNSPGGFRHHTYNGELHKSGRCIVDFALEKNAFEREKIKSIFREVLMETIGIIPNGFEFLNKYTHEDSFRPKAT